MVAYYFPYLIIIIIAVFFKGTKTMNLPFKPVLEMVNFTKLSHLKFESVKKYCSHRDQACRSNNTIVCGMKMVNNKILYKDFQNGCYLFLSNMCDHPEEEYFIIAGSSCEQYLTSRRAQVLEDGTTDPGVKTGDKTNSTETHSDVNDTVTEATALRSQQKFSPLYDVDTSFDFHVCPLSCSNVYSPECVNVNRGYGKYFKMLTFVNHCSADIYYCKNWKEFEPPPGMDEELIRTSPLGWSFCGANRYLQFARFSEAASSMGHYGWLAGDYRYSHIMEPHQRIPGYG